MPFARGGSIRKVDQDRRLYLPANWRGALCKVEEVGDNEIRIIRIKPVEYPRISLPLLDEKEEKEEKEASYIPH